MNILFLCVANSARSQMAEAIAKKLLPAHCEVHSAGSKPGKSVNPFALNELRRRGLATESLKPKYWESLPTAFLEKLDFVITLCKEENCPFLSTKAKRISWAMPDPVSSEKTEGEQSLIFKETADKIEERIQSFLKTNFPNVRG